MKLKLESTSRLAEMAGLTHDTALAALRAAGIEPVYEFPNGPGTTRLFESTEALRVLEKRKADIESSRAAANEPANKQKPAQPPDALLHGVSSAVHDLLGMVGKGNEGTAHAIGMLQARLDDLEESIEASFKRLTDQNALLLRAIESIARTAIATEAKEPAAAEAVSIAQPHTPVVYLQQQPQAKPKRPVVGVVGLTNAQFAQVQKEFDGSLDLRHMPADDARRPNFIACLKACQEVVVMTKFISHDSTVKLKAAGVKFVNLTGGMSTLRTELTAIFVRLDDNKGKEIAA